jgi:hypothetical protein
MKGTHRNVIWALFLISAIALPFTASAGDSEDARAEKTAGRLYAATFGASEFCEKAPPEAASAFRGEFARFSREYPTLLALLRSSPHYNAARLSFSDFAKAKLAKEAPESIAADCNAFSLLLKSMIDDPAGRNAEHGYEEQLGKK